MSIFEVVKLKLLSEIDTRKKEKSSVMSSSNIRTSTFNTYKNDKFKNFEYYLVLGFDRTNTKFTELLNELDLNMVHVPETYRSIENKMILVKCFEESIYDLSLLSIHSISRSPRFEKYLQ